MLILRLMVGSVFILSGFTKLMVSPEIVVEIIQSYRVLPQPLLYPTALVLPWVEFLSGSFLVIGLFTGVATKVVGLQLIGFMIILSYVLARGVNLEDCGCFIAIGLKETPLQALIRDAVLFSMTAISAISGNRDFSLDSFLEAS